jgi:hypothetical protein
VVRISDERVLCLFRFDLFDLQLEPFCESDTGVLPRLLSKVLQLSDEQPAHHAPLDIRHLLLFELIEHAFDFSYLDELDEGVLVF